MKLSEPVSKRFSLVKVKAGDPAKSGINRRNTFSPTLRLAKMGRFEIGSS
jgi:hypothetical protein